MAKFLTTTGNSHYLEQIMKKAKQELTLVTPYLQLSNNMIGRLKDADKKNVQITLIYGKSKLRDNEMRILKSLNNIRIFFCQNLHAKCYYNENSMIISSMNLYEFSEKNNREMGVLLNSETDIEIFSEAIEEVKSIINSSIIQGENQIEKNTHVEPAMVIEQNQNKVANTILQFDYPFLNEAYHVLAKKFSESRLIATEHIIVTDFPCAGGNIEIKEGNSIRFKMASKGLYKEFEKAHRNRIDKHSKYEHYWNGMDINFVLPKNIQLVNPSKKDLNYNIEAMMKIINSLE